MSRTGLGGPKRSHAASKTMTIGDVSRIGAAEAYDLLCHLRWGDQGGPVCPRCQSRAITENYSRQIFRCRGCRYDFSVTAGTTLQSSRLPTVLVLEAAFLFATARKGISSMQMADWLGTGQKTIWILLSRFREVMAWHQAGLKLSGIIEIDGVYFKGARRRRNTGRRNPPSYRTTAPLKAALTLIQRDGPVIAVPATGETRREVLAAVRQFVVEGSTIMTDEAPAYDFLRLYFELWRINHSVRYADGTKSTNNAETFHSRLRRSQRGVYHRMSSGVDLDLYLCEAAFRHSYQDLSTGAIWEKLISLLLRHPVSPRFAGYWQRSAGSASDSLEVLDTDHLDAHRLQ